MTDSPIQFHDRTDAGRQLAERLLPYKPEHPLILALPRGGVPVGLEVAVKLKAPLDTIVARKIGAPHNEELGVGAIAPPGVLVLDPEAMRGLGLRKKDLGSTIDKETLEMQRRISIYRSGDYSKGVKADCIIIVDDGLATGVTAKAAIESAKISHRPQRLIFASPICASETAGSLEGMVDAVVCVSAIENLMAIGLWYREFSQTTDEEVLRCLQEAKSRMA